MPGGHIEVREEYDLKPVAHVGIGVDEFRDRIRQLDDQFLLRNRLEPPCPRSEGAGRNLCIRVCLEAPVERKDVQNIQVLPLLYSSIRLT